MVKVRVQVKWSRLGSMSDSQGQGPCQTVKVKVRFEAMVGSLNVDSHCHGRMVMTKHLSAHHIEHAQGKGRMVMIRHAARQAPRRRVDTSVSKPATLASQCVRTDAWPRCMRSQTPSQVCRRPHSTTPEHAQRAPRQGGLKTCIGACILIGRSRGP